MTVEIISSSISTKVWERVGMELATPRSAVRHASVARHVTDCATRPGVSEEMFEKLMDGRRSHWYNMNLGTTSTVQSKQTDLLTFIINEA